MHVGKERRLEVCYVLSSPLLGHNECCPCNYWWYCQTLCFNMGRITGKFRRWITGSQRLRIKQTVSLIPELDKLVVCIGIDTNQGRTTLISSLTNRKGYVISWSKNQSTISARRARMTAHLLGVLSFCW